MAARVVLKKLQKRSCHYPAYNPAAGVRPDLHSGHKRPCSIWALVMTLAPTSLRWSSHCEAFGRALRGLGAPPPAPPVSAHLSLVT